MLCRYYYTTVTTSMPRIQLISWDRYIGTWLARAKNTLPRQRPICAWPPVHISDHLVHNITPVLLFIASESWMIDLCCCKDHAKLAETWPFVCISDHLVHSMNTSVSIVVVNIGALVISAARIMLNAILCIIDFLVSHCIHCHSWSWTGDVHSTVINLFDPFWLFETCL